MKTVKGILWRRIQRCFRTIEYNLYYDNDDDFPDENFPGYDIIKNEINEINDLIGNFSFVFDSENVNTVLLAQFTRDVPKIAPYMDKLVVTKDNLKYPVSRDRIIEMYLDNIETSRSALFRYYKEEIFIPALLNFHWLLSEILEEQN